MKKILAIIALAATLLSLLCGCGQKELEPIEKAQAKVVEIGQQYLDYEITAKEAIEQLEDIRVPETAGRGQNALETFRDGLIRRIKDPNTPYSEIKEAVDDIASYDFVNW